MTSDPDLLATYGRLRQTQRALNKRLTKMLSKKAIEESAKHLGCFEDGCVVADAESELPLIMDSAIYDYYPTGSKNAVARFAAQHAFDGDERLVRDAMLRARFTVVEVGESVEGVGVCAHDLVLDQGFFLADVALSQAGARGVVLATRLLTFESFSMTTGAHVVIDDDLATFVGRDWDALAGSADAMMAREASLFARFLMRLGMADPADARVILADFAMSQIPRDDPRRVAYMRSRTDRARTEP